MTKTVTVTKRGPTEYHVQLPDGDYGCQPSKDFAVAMARQWAFEHNEMVRIEWK